MVEGKLGYVQTPYRSLMGAGIFITAVVLGTVILATTVPFKIGEYYN